LSLSETRCGPEAPFSEFGRQRMIQRREFLRLAALGLPALSCIVFAAALTLREPPAWAGAAPVTGRRPVRAYGTRRHDGDR
jgi:hypothetical protein